MVAAASLVITASVAVGLAASLGVASIRVAASVAAASLVMTALVAAAYVRLAES